MVGKHDELFLIFMESIVDDRWCVTSFNNLMNPIHYWEQTIKVALFINRTIFSKICDYAILQCYETISTFRKRVVQTTTSEVKN